ncbi:hypothetical protein GCM10020000_86900 [Streptomyces olivoverticillatus]
MRPQLFEDVAIAASQIEEVLDAGEAQVGGHVVGHRPRVGPEGVVDPLLDIQHAGVMEEAVARGLCGELEVLLGDDALGQGVECRRAEVRVLHEGFPSL